MLHKQLRTLEGEIHQCETRIRLHDVRVRHGARLLRQKARSALNGKTLAVAGALAGAAAAAWGWSHTHPGRHDDHQHAGRASARHGRHARRRHRRRDWTGLSQRWMPLLLPMLSPLLNRKVAGALAGLGLPVAARPLRPLPTVLELDLGRYAGLWYEIARLPLKVESRCARDTTATYVIDGRGYEVVNRCVGDDGKAQEVRGRARQPDVERPGQLEVSFAPPALHRWPGSWADYWVLFVDDDYQVALVGTPDRDGLWILSRSTALPEADLEALKSLALRYGFDVSRLVQTPHAAAGSS
jgi:apolipoprotein D and lipocalin family protein